MGSLGRCLARGLLRGQPGLGRPLGPPRRYGSAPPELREQTLVLVKPDAVQRRLVGDVIRRFERRGFKLVAMKLLQVWEGYNVVRSSRAMVGDTNSAQAAAGTIRGDFSMHVSRNVVHASDSVETALQEIGFWFQRDELVAWESSDQDYTYGP
ncbi:nucleoside diphosphate kinase, mitochondrial-like isoform X2 [Oxyura jamaicensis]|uniref:nucleoside diphosphate kinase, mitochondrial-like isoform X2 n=1 Tax=Oxyura jamaicensis TaxID=8884 RepID=UPI0015A58106|nr:nucleoside diphosphate kinase, mitochondrial-like isoform X2 [Oxyura jamaicensis]